MHIEDNGLLQEKCSTKDKLTQSSDSTAENDESSVATIISKESGSYKKVLRPDADLNPLDWWQQHSSSYPATSQLSKKYLSICASSASSERVFSTSGHIVSKKRGSLKPNKVNMLVFWPRTWTRLDFFTHIITKFIIIMKIELQFICVIGIFIHIVIIFEISNRIQKFQYRPALGRGSPQAH